MPTDFEKITKIQNIINDLPAQEAIIARKIIQDEPHFCTISTQNCKKEKAQCHDYYEKDNNTGNINVCRTGNPCKSKGSDYNLSSKVKQRGTVMNKLCTAIVNPDVNKSVVALRRNSSNSKKKSISIISKKSSIRSSKSSTRSSTQHKKL